MPRFLTALLALLAAVFSGLLLPKELKDSALPRFWASNFEKRTAEGPTPRRVGGQNIIFILTDDQDRSSLQAMPSLKRLFPVSFPNHTITNPICSPSRETFLTGKYAHNSGVMSNLAYPGFRPDGRPLGGWDAAGSRQDNLGSWMQERGYYTALIGKYINGFSREKPVPQGWDFFSGTLRDAEQGYFNYGLSENGQYRRYGEEPGEYSTDVFLAQARLAMHRAEARGRPLFLFLSLTAPHTGSTSSRQPFLNPEPHPEERQAFAEGQLPFRIPQVSETRSYNEADTSDKPAYIRALPRIQSGGEIEEDHQRLLTSRWLTLYSLDRGLSHFVPWVEKHGRPTTFFYTSDNGFLLGQHRARGKSLPYEDSVSFPMLVRLPGERRTRSISSPIGNVDLAPTVLNLAGADPGQGEFDGQSFLPLLDGDSANQREILIESFPTPGDQASDHRPYIGVRTSRDVLVLYQRPGEWPPRLSGEAEYYDLDKDPDQLRNMISEQKYRARISYLTSRAKELANCVGRTCRQ